MNQEREETIRGIGEVLSGFDEVAFGYVFGSFLGDRDFRDVDVAIYVNDAYNSYDLMKYSMRVARTLERKVKPRREFDVKDLNTAPITFQYEVIRSGKLVFSRDNIKRVRFEAEVLSTFLDYKETLDWLNKKFLARI
ncbi:MAG: type VII toxin-antitoxin system MntA family adenylyltransferase antitoxin [Candidatus Jordarchaeum sp.]|uniref:type VII toxin-antitoxin system MntA family adenylyltransferase antitoxin n=1 Tax=Candidatus Jordarchaeum sp. TaxID=2823881 RepID=UPI00404B2E44